MELLATAPFRVANPRRDPVRPLDGPVAAPAASGPPDEALIVDARAGVTPAQMVERKLASLLKSQPVSTMPAQAAQHIRRNR